MSFLQFHATMDIKKNPAKSGRLSTCILSSEVWSSIGECVQTYMPLPGLIWSGRAYRPAACKLLLLLLLAGHAGWRMDGKCGQRREVAWRDQDLITPCHPSVPHFFLAPPFLSLHAIRLVAAGYTLLLIDSRPLSPRARTYLHIDLSI